MKKNFLTSVTAGIACLTLLSNCSHSTGKKESSKCSASQKESNGCSATNGCSSQKEANKTSKKSTNKCSSNKCSTNKCSSKKSAK